ncbi:MAG: DUF3307 domain-containing protein [Bacteroidota bacterium]|nr:DUF3307 domain-containing protein [Bacteroidota bacterium]
MTILLKLFLAHIIVDFLLQPTAWVKAKEEKKIAAWQLYVHSLLHGLLVLLFLWNWQFWKYALLISIAHLIIDSLKLILQNNTNRRLLFFIDQAVHFISIYLIWLWLEEKSFPFFIFENKSFLLLITGIIFLTSPVSFGVKIFISKWTPDPEGQDSASLQSAGKYIGFFERMLVFVFIIINQWAAVGFLLAAKSIFRFGDLKEAKDRKLTEYVLIGTLLSFGAAIFVGLLFKYSLRMGM